MRDAIHKMVDEVRKMMMAGGAVEPGDQSADGDMEPARLFPLSIDKVKAIVEGYGLKLELELCGPPPGRNQTKESTPR